MRRRLVYPASLAAIGLAVACLVIVDLLLRLAGPHISQDLSHLQTIGTRIGTLASQPSPRVLFIGNSLTKCGIDPAAFRESFRATTGIDPSVALVHPDDTSVADWYYLVRSRVAAPEIWPDVIVFSFAQTHLTDQASLDPRRLGAWMAGLSFAAEAFRYDVIDLGERVLYLLSAVSQLFADAEKVRNQVFALLVPHYRSNAQVLNRSVETRGGTRTAVWTFERLTRLLMSVPATRTRVVLVAVPLPKPFEMPEGLSDRAKALGALLEDLRLVEGVGPKEFTDGYHLGSVGARRFSLALGRRLANDLTPAARREAK